VLDEHELARRSLTWLIQAFGTGGRHAADTAVGVMVASPSRPEDRPGGKDENGACAIRGCSGSSPTDHPVRVLLLQLAQVSSLCTARL
jgi:hypothetical protein